MKPCRVCFTAKPDSEFYVRKDSGRLRRECKACLIKMHREKTLGVTEDAYQKLYSKQAGMCGICGGQPSKGKDNFSVDHCHKTGRIRGLLCNMCNLGIGHFKDSPEVLRKAASWVEDIV